MALSISSFASSFTSLSLSHKPKSKPFIPCRRFTVTALASNGQSYGKMLADAAELACGITPLIPELPLGMTVEKYMKSRLPGGIAAHPIIATGRRKCAIARVVLQEGNGKVIVNYRDAKVSTLPRLRAVTISSFPSLKPFPQTMAHVASSHFSLLSELRPGQFGLARVKPARLSFVPPQPQPRRLRSSHLRATTEPVEPQPISPPTGEQSAKPDLIEEKKDECCTNQEAGFIEFPNKDVNRRIALASSLGAVGLFFSSRLDFGVSLKDLAANAVPYEQALRNGKPTVVEFYADWCEVCRELAPDVYKIEEQYKDRVNFVMLNVDNTKWEQELDEFGVEGIPHFAFLDKEGNEEGNVVGKLPRQYFLDNIVALANGESTIPHARVVGQFSSAEARKVHQVSDPRSHG